MNNNDNKFFKDKEILNSLKIDRSLIYLGLTMSVLCAFLIIYLAIRKDRLELVFIGNENIDVPTKLEKVLESNSKVKVDRWIRGFVRRFLAYRFLHPHDSKEFSKDALAWLHAHTGEKGQVRSLALWNDFDSFDDTRKNTYSLFFPVNDQSLIKIRESEQDYNIIYVEIPGTYQTVVKENEAFLNATMKLVIKKVSITGLNTKLGQSNITGLIVLDGVIEYVDDLTKNEIKKISIF